MIKSRHKFRLVISIVIIFCALIAMPALAQVPQGIPNDNVPTDWSTWSARVWYIILPIAIIILYVAGRRRWKKPEDKQY